MKKFFYSFIFFGLSAFSANNAMESTTVGQLANVADLPQKQSFQVSSLEEVLAEFDQLKAEKLDILYAAILKERAAIEKLKKSLNKKDDKDFIDQVNNWHSSVFSAAKNGVEGVLKMTTFAAQLALLTWLCLVFTRLAGVNPVEAGLIGLDAVVRTIGSWAWGSKLPLASGWFGWFPGWLGGAAAQLSPIGVVRPLAQLSPKCAELLNQVSPLAVLLKAKYGCA